ncbi:hypothetical protein IJ768_02320 [Candidatus Saccharibacteria bacterium]|nr:hypothetical protein [Candidatus Saccharibacteria bacterium]
MKSRNVRKMIIISALLFSVTAGLTTANLVYATPPAKPSGSSQGGGTSSKDITYSGQYEFSESVSKSGDEYTTDAGGKNTILARDGTINFSNVTISKTGDEDNGDSSDFYGTNAAVLSIGTSKIKISNSKVTTAAKHANAVFAYGDSTIDISDSTIKTTENNSGGIMVTGGGTVNVTNLEVETDGNSSAPIRSDRGGGTMNVSGGSYKSNGVGSPVIYSTADVIVSGGAKLEATVSEGAVIEGKNSISLDNVEVVVNNTKLNSNSETYKAFFIYQSMSGDASEGTGTFTMKNSKVTNEHGEIFFITNTTANISLSKNQIKNNDEDGVFLKATSGKWGSDGKNGGDVTLTSEYEPLEGDIVIDKISTLDASFKNRTSYKGAINAENTAKNVKITLDSSSRIILTGDSYISELSNEVADNSNIFANGHKLYVAGEEVSINQEIPETWDYDFATESTEPVEEEEEANKDNLYLLLGAFSFAFVVALIVTISIIVKNKHDKQEHIEKKALEKVQNNMKKPWEKA